MKHKKLYIGLGVATLAVIAIGYYYHKSKKGSESLSNTTLSSGKDAEISNKINLLIDKGIANMDKFGTTAKKTDAKLIEGRKNEIKAKLPSVLKTLTDREKDIVSDGLAIADKYIDKIILDGKNKVKQDPMVILTYFSKGMEDLSKKYSEKEVKDLSDKLEKVIG